MIMFLELIQHALMITGFVFLMMLLIEYLNVLTKGKWQSILKTSRWGNYILAAILGIIPGCLGAFAVVSLYAHRFVSLGTLVVAMIATSGDEAFVMLSMFPSQAALLFLFLFAISIVAGYVTDLLFKNQDRLLEEADHELEIHDEDICQCFPGKDILNHFKNISFPRALLITMMILFLVALLMGMIEPHEWNWQKVSFTIGASFALFVIVTVPDHFLEEHLWQHVIKKHFLRIFVWTFAALLLIHGLEEYLDISQWIESNYYSVLIISLLIGIIPESGPHLIFVTLFAQGSIPFSILLASSIVQDGHGMLPLLAVSKKAFIWVKLINLIVGLIVGLIGLALFS
jgi:hypothetical protein